jgi:hypothetical protein
VGSDAGGRNVLAAFPRFVGVARMFFCGFYRLDILGSRWWTDGCVCSGMKNRLVLKFINLYDVTVF